jgi:uncharacterized membrane protein YjjP (DUF1212 family)
VQSNVKQCKDYLDDDDLAYTTSSDQRTDSNMTNLQTLQAQLAAIEAQILEANKAKKALKKLQACPLTHRTAPKYFDLQQAYMQAVKGQ